MNNIRRISTAVAATGLAFSLAACGGAEEEPDVNATPETSATPDAPESETPEAEGAKSQVFGPGCDAVPTSGDGSFDGMVSDPVATAASNNPLLSTLVTAVGEADLVDTLNGAEDITVFAPTNDAFAEIPEEDLQAVLADKDLLTQILTHHVVPGQMGPDEIAGEFETLNGDMLTVEGEGEEFTVEGANVICGNVPTANATVYIVDSVLMPS